MPVCGAPTSAPAPHGSDGFVVVCVVGGSGSLADEWADGWIGVSGGLSWVVAVAVGRSFGALLEGCAVESLVALSLLGSGVLPGLGGSSRLTYLGLGCWNR